MKITIRQLKGLIIEALAGTYSPDDWPELYDPEEVDRFPETAATKKEHLHADIVSRVLDDFGDDALLTLGDERRDFVLDAIDQEMERREAEEKEVDFSQISLEDLFNDIMITLQRLGSMNEGKGFITRRKLRAAILEAIGTDLPGGVDTGSQSVKGDQADSEETAVDSEELATVSDINSLPATDPASTEKRIELQQRRKELESKKSSLANS